MGEKDYDAPMHSAEHILNQTMNTMFGCGRSFSNHIEKKKSKCDYHFSRLLTAEELQLVENKVNEVITANLEITEKYCSRSEAEKQFDLSCLPETTGDQIRIVLIGDYDVCPCIGSHVANTSEIGPIKLNSCNYNEGVLRIRFKRELV